MEKGRSARVREAIVSISANDYHMCIDNVKPQVLVINYSGLVHYGVCVSASLHYILKQSWYI